eukprot:2038717-Prymnesium_polylepis.1
MVHSNRCQSTRKPNNRSVIEVLSIFPNVRFTWGVAVSRLVSTHARVVVRTSYDLCELMCCRSELCCPVVRVAGESGVVCAAGGPATARARAPSAETSDETR